MNKTVRTVALFAVLGVATVGCQKEALVTPQTVSTTVGVVHNVTYSVDGVDHNASFNSEEDWLRFFDRLFALAEEGRSVSICNAESAVNTTPSKEVLTFTTYEREEAEAWAHARVLEGYVVHIDYNRNTGLYTCTAIH